MTKRIFRAIIAVAMVVLVASLFIASSFFYDYFNRTQVTHLKSELSIVAEKVDEAGVSYFDNYDSSIFRYTLIAADGKVLYDSKINAKKMENHLGREEVDEALKWGKGSSARYSSTLTERTFYEAVRLQNGDVLRISVSQLTVGMLLYSMIPAIAIVVIVSVLVALAMSHRMARSIVKPLGELDLEHPAENDTYEELTPFLTEINRQHKQITEKMKELKQFSDEFRQISVSMNEGLVLLDEHGTVISINPAAQKLFDADDDMIGRDFLVIDRSADMNAAVEKAITGKRSVFREERNGNEYQFVVSRTESNGETTGVVILCLDVTEMAFAERNRREFTANVSHELKTPLQSILGSAELLDNGLVKPEDTKKFIGNIRTEATRLLAQINNIIRLSQLHEEREPPTEPVDLYEVAKEVIDGLSVTASKNHVELNLSGEPCVMVGVRRYLYEIIYNLCDNAIRYSNDGGKVEVNLKNKDGNIILYVKDSGIGIPDEHQSRIFERFYRVDKSHSKEAGGTGLGLSIVKHAVAYHDGTVKLDSESGKGTKVTVVFKSADSTDSE